MNVFTARAPRASARGRVVVDVDDFNDDDDDFDDDDDSDSDSDSEDGDELKRPMGDRMKAEEEKRQKYKARVNAGEGAQVVIIGDDDVPYAAWRCAVLEREDSDEDPGLALRALRARASEPWVVVLARGGAFAAAVFDARKFVGDGEAPKASALEHATASRYVVRAKAGGRQVTKDQGGKNIKSAGSSLRRANEQALEADMRAVFERWKDVVARASRIFISVSKVDAIKLFDGKHPMLDRKDPRIRRVPFMTKKPTFDETRRVAGRLAAVNPNVVVEPEPNVDDLQELAETKFIIAAKPKPPPLPVVEALVEPEIPEPDLHAAARGGDADRVFVLLTTSGANPTEVYKGKLPYAVSKDRETRDAFRRAMAQMPDAWDWIGAAAVPSALTADLEAKHAAKEAEYEAARKEKEKERKKSQKERKKQESSAAALLAKTQPAVVESGAKKSAALVDKVDKVANDRREQMALAAERRIQALEAAKRSNVGALGGGRFNDATTFGGGSYAT